MHALLNTAFKAARQAGEIMVRAMDRLDKIEVSDKGRHDFVTDIDKQCEAIIVEQLREAYPSHAILAEESGTIPLSEGVEADDYLWLIDPLDGTTNFIHGFPHFAISIAVKLKGRLEHALVFDPVQNELFTASRGEGAVLNHRRIRVTQRPDLEGAFLATGSPFGQQENLPAYLGILNTVYPHAAGIRRAGSAALDLAYVAAGRFDAYWEMGLKPWDMAAGALLIKEAGGLVSDYYGGEDYLEKGNIVVGNPKIFKAILQAIAPFYR